MALRESSTMMTVTCEVSAWYKRRSATMNFAPRLMASCANECPSTTRPTMQKNMSPGCTASLR